MLQKFFLRNSLRMSKTELLVDKGYINEDWAELLEPNLEYFYSSIIPEIKNSAFYPEDKNIFRAFNECEYKDLKVVILAQDPYFDGSATGLAFDNTRTSRKISLSLSKILQEIKASPTEDTIFFTSEEDKTDSYLGHLPKQGVLLLNTGLTVKPKEPGSHTELWRPFTEGVIKKINEKDNIVWILWGNHAKAFKSLITNKSHKIVEGCHPAARGKNNTFLGGKYFSKTNAYLKKMGHSTIDW